MVFRQLRPEAGRAPNKNTKNSPGTPHLSPKRERSPDKSDYFRCQAMARTLQEIAETKGESFYRGRLAQKIADYAKATGGLLTYEDLAQHQVEWVVLILVMFLGIPA